MNQKVGKTLFITACVVIAAVLLIFIVDGDGDSSSYFPIFWVALIPIFTNKRKKEKEAAEKAKREKAKRIPEGMDMYSMIDRVMDDLDDDEMDYLERRVDEVHGSEFAVGHG